ncbi:MAG: hypothetical protein ACTHOH_03895 [Lysobacteraceae bacterium]
MTRSPALFRFEDDVDFFGGEKDNVARKPRNPDGTRNPIARAKVKLTVSQDAGTQITHYAWEKRTILFHTNEERQVLEIEIDSPQIFGERPRFHLDLVDHNEDYIRSVAHEVAPGTMVTLGDPRDELPEHTSRIAITLSLPAHGPKTSFKLFVYARDRELRRRINCDPIVGNDPPRTA